MKTEEQVIVTELSNRPQGKTVKALLEFLQKGKAGKIIVYVTAEGTFYSPAAMDRFLIDEKNIMLKIIVKKVNKTSPIVASSVEFKAGYKMGFIDSKIETINILTNELQKSKI